MGQLVTEANALQTVDGHCPLCEKRTTFFLANPKFYRSMKCQECQSTPRQRALFLALSRFCPNWRTLKVHESSPGWDRVSQRLAVECEQYTASQWESGFESGTLIEKTKLPCKKYYIENLEEQTFEDNAFDLVVTQDVFEHIFNPDRAIAEIARTLKTGGCTIMSVPVVRRSGPSQRRARLLADGTIQHLLPAEFHGNPVNGDGAIVTIDWGFDIGAILAAASGMHFLVIEIDDLAQGIRDEFGLIVVGFKRPLPDLG